MHKRDRHTQQVADSLDRLPDLWDEGYDGGKDQVEATRTASTQEKCEPKAIPPPRRVVGNSATIRGLKHAETIISTAHPFASPAWPVRKETGFGEGRWIIVSVTRQQLEPQLRYQTRFPCLSKPSPGIWYVAVELASAFLSTPLSKVYQKPFSNVLALPPGKQLITPGNGAIGRLC